ncbi:Gfo/Idh/MocA family protein [Haloferula sp. A504]|uniref:Gfo/Idh/MocA family protein n=1 Tax=Haloferula sp. A504 TaxID=3373601 RepID=UPI0031BC91AF|nr:Gfo/Idh/MocA family oxidoreductase [Verrucomicrobiaceae bacterium E54]
MSVTAARPDPTRRKLLGCLAAATAPLIIPSRLLGKDAPSNKITLGFIGVGSHGISRNLGTFLNQPDARVIAVCDARKSSAAKAKQTVDQHSRSTNCLVYQDFREVIARTDIDAIVISTPDHWHVPMSLAALRAGKDVFCEKPSLTITEGRELVDEVAKRNAVFQWGLEDRSLIKYHRLAGWVRSGMIGTLKTVEVTLPHNRPYPKESPAQVPRDLDWNLWLGPAPFHPYTKNRTHPQHWRMIRDYSGGVITDWGSHLVDTAQIGAAMEHSGPIEITGTCDIPDPATSESSVPYNSKVRYRYANGVEISVAEGEVDIRFVGSDGWVRCKGWNGEWSASNRDILRNDTFPESARFWPLPPIEHRDFLDAMKSRGKPAYHVEAGHRLCTTLHLGHLAARSGRKIRWNPESETFADGDTESVKSPIYRREARDWEAGHHD